MDYIYEAEVSMIAGSMLFGRMKEVAFEGEYP